MNGYNITSGQYNVRILKVKYWPKNLILFEYTYVTYSSNVTKVTKMVE